MDIKILDQIFLFTWGSLLTFFVIVEGEFKIRVGGFYLYQYVLILLGYFVFRLGVMVYGQRQRT